MSKNESPVNQISEKDMFEQGYCCGFELLFECSNCHQKTTTKDFSIINYLSLDVPDFSAMLANWMKSEVSRTCDKCGMTCISTVTRTLIKAPEFLFIALSRWKTPNEKLVDDIYWDNDIEIDSYNYTILSCIYHKGESPTSGHYFTKTLLTDGSIATLDDSRCNSNPKAISLEYKDAYLLVYQKSNSRQSDIESKANNLNPFEKKRAQCKAELEKYQKEKSIMKKKIRSNLRPN